MSQGYRLRPEAYFIQIHIMQIDKFRQFRLVALNIMARFSSYCHRRKVTVNADIYALVPLVATLRMQCLLELQYSMLHFGIGTQQIIKLRFQSFKHTQSLFQAQLFN